jgi:hypothetical protein
MAQITLLLDKEDAWRESLGTPEPDHTLEARERLARALSECVDAGEQAELTRLFVKSERLEREASRESEQEAGRTPSVSLRPDLQPIATEAKPSRPKTPQVATGGMKKARQSPSGKRRA